MMILNTLATPSPRLLKRRPSVWITSSTSFIAKNILEQLDYNFTTTRHNELDLTNNEAVNAFLSPLYFDYVIHTACVGGRQTDDNHEDIFTQNYEMFNNLFENQHSFKYLINIGSTSDRTGTGYGRAKRLIAGLIRDNKNMFNLRCEGVWGKYEKEDRFPSTVMNSDEIIIFEDKPVRYIHVDELVKIVDTIINKWPKTKREMTLGEPIMLSEFAKQLNPNIVIK